MEVKMDGGRWPVPSLGHRLGSKLLSYFHIFLNMHILFLITK